MSGHQDGGRVPGGRALWGQVSKMVNNGVWLRSVTLVVRKVTVTWCVLLGGMGGAGAVHAQAAQAVVEPGATQQIQESPSRPVRFEDLTGAGGAPKPAKAGAGKHLLSLQSRAGLGSIRNRTVSKLLGLSPPDGAVTVAKRPRARIAGKLRLPISVQGKTQRKGSGISARKIGVGIKVGLDPVRVISGAGALRIDSRRGLELEPAESGTTVLSVSNASEIAARSSLSMRSKTAMPWVVVDRQSTIGGGGVGVGDDVRVARPFLQLAQAVRWDPDAKHHVAEFWVGLQSEGGHAGPLSEPLTAVLSVSCDEVTPTKVTLAAIGPAGDQRIRVVCSRHVKNERTDQSLGVRLADGRLNYPFSLPRRPGPYELAVSTNHVSGFGIGEFTLTVTQTEVDGTPLPVSAADALSLPLVVIGGEVDAPTVEFEPGESQASMVLHAAGVGALTIRVGTAERQSQTLSIERTWPLSFMFSTLLGGGMGGYLAGLGKRARRAARLRRVGEGALVGVLLVGLFVLVPSTVPLFPDWARTNELAWWVIAGVAGFVGVELVKRAAGVLFPKRAARASA